MFDSRAAETEYLDRPECDAALAAASYRFMERINRYFGGIRAVRRFLADHTPGPATGGRLRILDIGAGSCDIPLAVIRWAAAGGIRLHFTCLETSGHALDIARDRVARAGNPSLQLIQEDVFSHQPDQPYDYAVASMCFHHFSDARILHLLQRLRGFVRRGVLINDLRRSRLASLVAEVLLLGAPEGVRHDALLSIRRGFKVAELEALLRQLSGAGVAVKAAPWFRIAAVIGFEPEATPTIAKAGELQGQDTKGEAPARYCDFPAAPDPDSKHGFLMFSCRDGLTPCQ